MIQTYNISYSGQKSQISKQLVHRMSSTQHIRATVWISQDKCMKFQVSIYLKLEAAASECSFTRYYSPREQ